MEFHAETTEKPEEGLRERKKREKRARILASARALFAEQGFDETTARQICEHAGIATGTLFLYVTDKRELLLWVFEEDARRVLARPRRAGGGAVEGWMALLGALLTLYARNPNLSSSYVKELLFREERPPELTQLDRELHEAVLAITHEAQAAGELRTDIHAREIGDLVLGQYGHLIQLWLGLRVLGARQVRSRLRQGLTRLVEGVGK